MEFRQGKDHTFTDEQKRALKKLSIQVELNSQEEAKMQDPRYKATHAAVVRLLTALAVDQTDTNYKETPRRVAEWLLEKFPDPSERATKLAELAKSSFPTRYNGLIAQTRIRVYGLCPHHLKDIRYEVAIGYLPAYKVIGLSKLTRIADLCLGAARVQEDATEELADTLQKILSVLDVAVVVVGQHFCMTSRGVRQHDAKTTTAEMRGLFRSNSSSVKDEFLQLVHNGGTK